MDIFHGPSPATAILLQEIERRLTAGDTAGALQELRTTSAGDPWRTNARAVCLMRAGFVRDALEVLQKLALEPDSVALQPGLPVLFAANYATALLLDQNVEGARIVLRYAGEDGHPSVVRLREHIERWRAGLAFLERLRYRMYGVVARPIAAPEPLGELSDPRVAPQRAA